MTKKKTCERVLVTSFNKLINLTIFGDFSYLGLPPAPPSHTPITPLQKGEGGGRFEFSKFSKKWEGSDFSHKMGRVGKIWGGRGGGGCSEKGRVSLIPYFQTSLF